jgi:hypothetical protein
MAASMASIGHRDGAERMADLVAEALASRTAASARAE